LSPKADLRLDWCSHEAAKYACEHWHYSGCVPNQKTVKVGVWESGRFIGCVLFGDGANQNVGGPYGLPSTSVCELVRVALTSHSAPVTRIVRVALSFLAHHCPDIRLVVSFADPDHGHVGGIYQAGNWFYAGKTSPADEYLVNGVRMHGRALRSTRSTHRFGGMVAENVQDWATKALGAEVVKVDGSSKFRYLMPLDAEMRAKIAPLAKPYPKRERSRENAAALPSAEGGVNPTRSLQTSAVAA
jgi:hypothetical protein